jgi:hypothetical protein
LINDPLGAKLINLALTAKNFEDMAEIAGKNENPGTCHRSGSPLPAGKTYISR